MCHSSRKNSNYATKILISNHPIDGEVSILKPRTHKVNIRIVAPPPWLPTRISGKQLAALWATSTPVERRVKLGPFPAFSRPPRNVHSIVKLREKFRLGREVRFIAKIEYIGNLYRNLQFKRINIRSNYGNRHEISRTVTTILTCEPLVSVLLSVNFTLLDSYFRTGRIWILFEKYYTSGVPCSWLDCSSLNNGCR